MPMPEHPPTILFVEDEPLIRMIATDSLEASGLVVIEAANAAEALVILAGHPEIVLIVTDINMPGEIDGIGLACRAAKEYPAIRLVLSSGRRHHGTHELPVRGKFLPKPYLPTELVALVRGELDEIERQWR